MMSFAGVVTFDADADKGNAGTDSNNAAAYTITKGGVTVEVSSGILGTYNNEMHYRIYKNQTLKITSTVGNITSVQFTCTGNGSEKYGPGCFTVDTGDYTNDGAAVGTWTGSATEITFTAATNQVRASQIVVTIDGEVGETPEQPETPEEPETPVTPENPEGVITCAEAVAICEATGETSTTETYTIRGYVTEIKTAYSEQYSNISFWMADTPDGGQVLLAYRVKPVNAADINVAVGDFVEVVGTLVNYYGNTPEVNAGGTYTIVTAGEDNNDPVTPPTTDGAVTFDADVDQGNAGTDSNNAAAYTITKSGVTMEVSSGILGTYNNEMHYRVYKNQTLTLTSTVGKIVKVEFTCTANDAEKYGPGCFTVDGGEYTYAGAVGTWTGSADAIVFTASTNQVRATQVVVTLASTGTGVEDVVTVEVPVKVIENGQLMIIRGENVYNVLGAQVK